MNIGELMVAMNGTLHGTTAVLSRSYRQIRVSLMPSGLITGCLWKIIKAPGPT